MKSNIISIIVPIYNVEIYLAKCLDSILNQTFTDFELILVNDGSTDSCKKICEYYSTIDSRVKVIHKENEGVSSARNKGIEIASGSYIAFVDPDDTIEPNMYELLYQSAIQFESDIVICPIKTINLVLNKCTISSIWKGENSFLDKRAIEEHIIPAILKNKTYSLISCVNKLYKSSLFKQLNLRFEIDKHHSEDARLNLKLLTMINKIIYIDRPLYNYYIRKRDSLTQIFNENLYDYICDNKNFLLDICDKYNFESYKKNVNNHYVGVTLTHMIQVVNNDALTLNNKYKILLSILKDDQFYQDLLNYKCPSLFYKIIKLVCIKQNAKIFYWLVLAKISLQSRISAMKV